MDVVFLLFGFMLIGIASLLFRAIKASAPAVLGMFVIILVVIPLASLFLMPKVFDEFPWHMTVIATAGLITTFVSIYSGRAMADWFLRGRAVYFARRFKTTGQGLHCSVVNTRFPAHSEIPQLHGTFSWFPADRFSNLPTIRTFSVIIIFIILTALFVFGAREYLVELLPPANLPREESTRMFYPVSALMVFVLPCVLFVWLYKKYLRNRDEEYHDYEYIKFNNLMNDILPLGGVNSERVVNLTGEIIRRSMDAHIDQSEIQQRLFADLGGKIAESLRAGSDTKAIEATVAARLDAAVKNLKSLRGYITEFYDLKNQIVDLDRRVPDTSEHSYRLRQFLEAMGNPDDFMRFLMARVGPDFLGSLCQAASVVVTDLSAYLAERRGGRPGGGERRAEEQGKSERNERSREPPRGSGRMSRAEALSLLGLQEGATRTQIEQAYRRLMRVAHPDMGGTNGLAAKLNEARDVLLK